MKRHLFWIASLALGMAACTDTDINNEEPQQPEVNNPTEEVTSNLTTVKLAVFPAESDQVVYETNTRADEDIEPGQLKLVATINNPDKSVKASYANGSGDRYLSATSLFKNPDDNKYYVTYHFQGNNYNTEIDKSIGGAIQTFSLATNSDGLVKINENGTIDVNVETGYVSPERNKLDFDFNHIYFDKIDHRIIVMGHKWSVPESYTGDEPYSGENTRAIIGSLNADGTLTYENVTSSIEVRDKETNKLIDHEDAGDVNCAVRIYNNYYLATRKGIAVLNAKSDNLFQPTLNEDKTRYFIPTKGSCKFVNDDPHDYTRMQFLYLSEDKENIKDQTSEAKIVEFKIATDGGGSDSEFIGFINEDTGLTVFDSKTMDLTTYNDQFRLPAYISPIDGKNTICSFDNFKKAYVALGKGGFYYQHPTEYDSPLGTRDLSGVVDFGDKPVNNVYAENPSGESFHRGYVYVANGAKLTIIDRASLDVSNNVVDVVAEYTLSKKDGISENEASANYINVEYGQEHDYSFEYKGNTFTGKIKERIITVAYGQAGVRVFRFLPKVSSAYLVDYDLKSH